MYREFEIKDEEDKVMTLKVYPEDNNRIDIEGEYVGGSVNELTQLIAMVNAVQTFMGINQICNLKVKEKR